MALQLDLDEKAMSGKRLSSRVVKVDASEVGKPPNWKPAINEHEAVLKLQQAARAKQLQRTQAQFVCRLMHVQLSRAFTQWEEARAIELTGAACCSTGTGIAEDDEEVARAKFGLRERVPGDGR